jgi:hypothetical protein
MAIRFAVANGNWSNTATWNGGTLPTTGDDVYSNNFRVIIDVANIDAAILTNGSNVSPAINSGGGFTTSVNCDISSNINGSNATDIIANKLLIISNNTTTNLSGTINHGTVAKTIASIVEVLAGSTLNYTGGELINSATTSIIFYFIDCYGTANINANVTSFNGNSSSNSLIVCRSASVVVITGNITQRNTQGNASVILQLGGSTCSIFGDAIFNTGISLCNTSTPNPSLDTVFNFVGNIIHNLGLNITSPVYSNAANDPRFKAYVTIGTFTRANGSSIQLNANRGEINIISGVTFTDAFSSLGLFVFTGASTNLIVNFTGNLKGSAFGTTNYGMSIDVSSTNLTLNIFGNIQGGDSTNLDTRFWNYGLVAGNTTMTIGGNIVVIGSDIGESPGMYARGSSNIFIKRAITGAAPKYTNPYQGQIRFLTDAPEIQVSKQDNTVATLSDPALQDYPSINDVRDGVEYGFLSYEGNLIVPPSGNVSLNYNYDSNGSVTGSAILTPQDLFTAITDSPDPIAERLRNVSTVETTGDQIVAFFP